MNIKYFSKLTFIGMLGIAVILIESCSSENEPEPVDCSVNPVSIDNASTTEATCGVDDGSLTINASGGSGEYMYSINNIDFQSDNTFDGLKAGNYTVTVKDMNECTATADLTIQSSSGMTMNAQNTADAGCETSLGEITVDVSGGDSPYQFKVDGGSFQNDNVLTGLPAGTHTVIVQDANGCEITSSVDVKAGTSLENEVMTIITANCAISGCHDGSTSLPDWSVKSNVIANSGNIKQRTGNKTMPPSGSSISDEAIQTIACWVDDGAPNN